MSDAALRKQLIRLAHANPEMRPHILPLLREAGTVKKAHGPVAIQGPQVMLYAIDAEKNQSKFYEMTVVPFGTTVDRARPTVKKDKDFRRMGMGGYTLAKRWGRLTDTGGISGRFDGMDEFYDSEAAALGAMRATKADKMRGSGSAAYKDVSDTREYPIGLGAAGFGWGGQAACAYIPELAELHTAIEANLKNVTRLKAYVAAIARRDSSMGKKLDLMLEPLIEQMSSIDTYLEMQLSECR